MQSAEFGEPDCRQLVSKKTHHVCMASLYLLHRIILRVYVLLVNCLFLFPFFDTFSSNSFGAKIMMFVPSNTRPALFPLHSLQVRGRRCCYGSTATKARRGWRGPVARRRCANRLGGQRSSRQFESGVAASERDGPQAAAPQKEGAQGRCLHALQEDIQHAHAAPPQVQRLRALLLLALFPARAGQ